MNNNFTLDELKELHSLCYHGKSPIRNQLMDKIDISIRAEERTLEALQTKFRWVGPDEYNIDTLCDAPEGVYITFYYQACSNVRVQCTIPPEQELKLWKRASYTHASTSLQPVCIAMKAKRDTWTFLQHNAITNNLWVNGLHNYICELNELTNVGIIDYGYCHYPFKGIRNK